MQNSNQRVQDAVLWWKVDSARVANTDHGRCDGRDRQRLVKEKLIEVDTCSAL